MGSTLGVEPSSTGVYITFDSVPGFELALPTLDPSTGTRPPELLSVRTLLVGTDVVERATVFVPDGSIGYFIRRFEQYATEDTSRGRPRNANFVERIAGLRLATIEALWTDSVETYPGPDELIWWEAWLRTSDGRERERMEEFASATNARLNDRHLVFDNRIIVLILATARQLASAIDLIDDLAELRRAKESAAFFAGLPADEQAAWVRDLAARLDAPPPNAPAICILDTGVNRGHPLLEPALSPEDTQTCYPRWETYDHHGHGTEMAGLALFGDLTPIFDLALPVSLRHRLESVKILPPGDEQTPPDLYAAVTAEAVSRAEVQAPVRRRAFSMAVTVDGQDSPGTPTSWSSAIDALAAGRSFDSVKGELRYLDEHSIDDHRLFLISAGNIKEFFDADLGSHIDRCNLNAVEDPAQAWNAVTVGAYTDLADVAASGSDFDGFMAVATPGEVSPFSRTSVLFDRQWPLKPEIVLEGGNTARSASGETIWPPSLQVLTTHLDPSERLLTTSMATSAATAQAAMIAGTIMAEYPALWPESVRALLVHSAEWTSTMKAQFDAAGESRAARTAVIRRYGFGVPATDRALRSAGDALTMIVQDTISPYDYGKLREMHLHDLPWPVEALVDLGNVPVRLRVTVSYFIEPNPTRRGWRRRYRYASHGLRFELNRPEESNEVFRKRLNRLALAEEEGRPSASDDSREWFLGDRARNLGSLHSDLWQGRAIDLAARKTLAIFPVSGWWKELPRRDRSELGVRYGLVISIETPVETADLWTPVAQQVGLPIVITT